MYLNVVNAGHCGASMSKLHTRHLQWLVWKSCWVWARSNRCCQHYM